MPILDFFEDIVQFHRPRGFESKFSVYRGAAQAIASGPPFKIIQFDTVTFDTLNEFNLGTWEFVPVSPGYYYFLGQSSFAALAAGTVQQMAIHIDAATYAYAQFVHTGAIQVYTYTGKFAYLTPANAVTLRIAQNSGAPQNIVAGNQFTWFEGFRVA